MNASLRVCPDTGEIARLAPQGANAELQAHLASCPECAEDWRAQREMARLGPALPFTQPDPPQQRRVRAAVLARLAGDPVPLPAPPPPRRWWRPLLVAAASGAAAAALLLWLARPARELSPPVASTQPVAAPLAKPGPATVTPLRPPATLRAWDGARFTRESGPPHERVRLHQGRLLAEVRPARAGESFRIVTARGEVEVRGTIFETVATAAGLQSVRVQRGRVVVRPGAGTEIVLEAGEHWQRAAERAPARPQGPRDRPLVRTPEAPHGTSTHWRTAEDVPRPATGDGPPMIWPELDRPAPAAARAETAEAAFGSGLQLLRGGKNDAAADAFDRAAALAPTGPLAEDAWYWRAVALARTGASSGRAALGQFLDRYPFSSRRGEAAVMLGWLLLDHGDLGGARRQFRLGQADRSARVRGSAEAGLAKLAAAGASPH